VCRLVKADPPRHINIRDKEGKSTWPNKNTEEAINRVLNTISFNSAQKEYFNNPISEGDIFKELTYGKCPPLSYCEDVVVYADPSTSNKDKGKCLYESNCYCRLQAAKILCLQNVGRPDEQFEICRLFI
jgi:hypothetical protein